MLELLIKNNGIVVSTFGADWTETEVEEEIERLESLTEGSDGETPLYEDLIHEFADDCELDWSKCDDWQLYQKEELCELLSGLGDDAKQEALYLYLQNQHFSYTSLDSFEKAFLGWYSTEEEYALESNSSLIAAVEGVGFTASIIDEEYLAKEYGADYTFEATGGGVYCFSN